MTGEKAERMRGEEAGGLLYQDLSLGFNLCVHYRPMLDSYIIFR